VQVAQADGDAMSTDEESGLNDEECNEDEGSLLN
jgi:hypothetical protein